MPMKTHREKRTNQQKHEQEETQAIQLGHDKNKKKQQAIQLGHKQKNTQRRKGRKPKYTTKQLSKRGTKSKQEEARMQEAKSATISRKRQEKRDKKRVQT